MFSAALLGKMLLNPRIINYGFVLAMPATVLVAAAAVSLLPESLFKKRAGGQIMMATAVAAVLGGIAHHISWSDGFYRVKTLRVWDGADSFMTYPVSLDSRGLVLEHTARWIEENTDEGESLLILPEGAIVPYWTRRVDPVGFPLLMPADLISAGGEDVVLSRIIEARPDIILFVHRPVPEYGTGMFGSEEEYGQRILSWIEQNYHVVGGVGGEPLRGERFGSRVLRRTD